ncbi:integrase core domain-containing protein [Streptomyces sp. W16]|nr:integrase core domain-containing protein [Streptomyces sp. W16]MDV9171993.1 integrase core domain-containing protein [Streptomyces sp. W16]
MEIRPHPVRRGPFGIADQGEGHLATPDRPFGSDASLRGEVVERRTPRHSGLCRDLVYPTLNQTTAIQFVDYVLQRLPFQVEVIQTDTGAKFQSAFHFHVLVKGTGHACIKPRTPRLNGKSERSHRIDGEEFYQLLEGIIIDDAEVFNDKLREWKDYCDYRRPHGGLGGQTPYERLKQKTALQA